MSSCEDSTVRATARRLTSLRPFRVVIVATLGIFVILGGTGAVAATGATSTSGDRSSHHRTFQIVTTLGSATTNSAGQGGVGDVTAFVQNYSAPTGEPEHAYVSCQTFPGPVNLCDAALNFPKGQIHIQAEIPLPPTQFSAAVIGGTGIYTGVTGVMDTTGLANGTALRVFHLTFPEDD